MTRLLLRLLLLALLGVWTALPAGPVRAMAFSAFCCDHHASIEAGADHAGHTAHATPAMQDGDAKRHAQMCEVHCLPVVATRMGDAAAPAKAWVSLMQVSLVDVSLSSEDVAPSSPPPRV